jgi:hypothetical protein
MSEAALKGNVEEVNFEKRSVMMVARKCLKAADGDWGEAKKLFMEEINSDLHLRDELFAPMIDRAVHDAIRQACRKIRSEFKHRPYTGDVSGLVAMAHQHAQDWLGYPLVGGKKLGDASHNDLIEEASRHDSFARENAVMALMFKRIAGMMDGAARVRDVLSNEAIAEIDQQMRHAVYA